jgi:D-tyrosyl-tRNA(Tyr) deacylase
MRIILQRVKHAYVSVNGATVGQINKGVLLLVGVHKLDVAENADFLAAKCADLRIFTDSNDKMNLSLKDIDGEALVVSQFTLFGDCSKGRRPSFIDAAPPEKGNELYIYFVNKLKTHVRKVETGIFGAHMDVNLVNDGPVTLILEK